MRVNQSEHYFIILLWFIWCTLLIILSLRGSDWLRKRSEQQDSRPTIFGNYEKLVSYWMIFIALGLGCMIVLVLFTIVTR